MRKKLFWLTMLICLASVFALSSCNLNDYTASGKNGATFTLNGELASEAVFGEELDLSSLSVVKTENGTSETIPVTKEMIISGNTSQVGLQTITFSYEGSTFTRTVNVKYRVVFKNGNDVVSTQYVTSASEIIPPTVESTDAYEFKSWTPGIEGELTGNVTYSANYSVKVPTPPTTLNATYGTKLSELTLPSNSAGAWVFDAAASATVGNAGAANNEFNISFIVNGAVEKTAKVNINVAKKPLEFKNLVTEFIYNGSRQIPTFDFGSDVINPDNVLFFEDGRSDYTSVGEYTYDFFIDDPNYEGEATGTYVIKKADVSVDIESYVISVIDALPKIEYTVTGPVPEALLGIAVKADSYSSAGTYGITASTSNPNVNLTVTGGVLTVTVAYPNINDIGYPIISGGGSNFDLSIDRNREKGIDAVYEQTFEDYTFSYSAYGAWRWEKSGLIGDASETAYVCKIIFTHNNSLYEPLVMEIPVKVSKKVLEITVTSNEATYDGKEHGIEYSIFDADGKQYTNIKVENYATYVNAGSYNLNLYINEQNYTSIKYEETLTIKKSNTPPDADFEQTFSIVWNNALQLGDVILPERYVWVDETLDIDEIGKFSFDAEYTPLDANNYNTVPGKITVEILPAKAEIFGAKESYTATYNGEAYAIKGLTANYNDPMFEISFTQNGDEVKPINAGIYDVIISLPAQGCYDAAAPISATLTISKANASFIGYESSYETEYNGDAFVISGITDTNTDIDVSFTYVKDGVTVDEIKNAGTYTVTITLPESDNYNAASESVEVTVTVNKKANTDTIPTYSANSLGGNITFGDALSTVTLPTSAYGSWTWENPDALVGNATTTGNTHKAIFTPYPQYEENYAAHEADVTVIVAKKVIPTPAVPDANKSQTYTGGNLYVGIDNDTLYTVNEYTAIDVATYTVTITLTAEAQANYAWDSATNTSATTSVQFSITKAQAEITNLTLPGWVYSPDNANANEPDADSSFGTPTFTYYKGAVKLDAKPTAAGTYTVKATVEGTKNYEGGEDTLEFTIAKADASFSGYLEEYETEYNGSKYEISGITDTNTDIDVSFTYTKDGETVSEIKNAGTYTVTITLAESDNYNAAPESVEVTVTVNKKTNTDTIPTYSINSAGNPVTFGDALSTISLPTSTYGTWTWNNSADLVGTATATGNTHTATFTPYSQYADNYASREADVTVIVAKKAIPTPTVPTANLEQTYTGGNLYVGIDDDTLYTVDDYTAIDVATYTVTITLTEEAQANYVWEAPTADDATKTSVQFSITKAQAEITNLTLPGWTYSPDNANANEPDADSSFGTPTFTYYKGAVKLDAKPTAAGTYTVKATVEGTKNYEGDEDMLEFTIEKADASITAAGNESTKEGYLYYFTYDGSDHAITGVTASHSEAELNLDIKTVKNASSYTVTASVAETANYKPVTLTFFVFVEKAENTHDKVTVSQKATFGDLLSKLALPKSATGTWSWKNQAADATVGNATTAGNTFIAKYTDTSGNYFDKEVTVTVTVDKATVKAPTVADKEYDGTEYIPTIPTDTRYTVTENNGGTNMGTYRVVLKLTDSLNFKWESSVEEEITVTYQIAAAINSWTTEAGPSISSSWYYGQSPTITGAEAIHGGVKIEYAPIDADEDDYTEALPTDAGSYKVRFTTTDTNYTILTATSTFTINPAIVTVPALEKTTIAYIGSKINPAVVDKEEDVYTITYVNSIDVGSYSVTLSLKNTSNYVWDNGGTDDVTLPYSITKADAGLTASITGWTYSPDNANANEPTYTASFTLTGVYFLYAGADGNYSATVPTAAGDYTVKAVYSGEGDNNINRSESLPASFTISKADASFSGYLGKYETEYNGSKYEISGITDTNTDIDVSFTYTKDGETVSEIKNAGTYTVTITLAESDNYNAAPESVEVTVTVNKKANTDTIPTYSTNSLGNAITFGDALSTISLPTSTYGTWTWNNSADLVGNATTTGNTHKATFTPYSQYADNYASREADVTVIVAKKAIPTPTVPTANLEQTYTGGNLYVGIDNDTLYTVDDYTAIDVATYTVTITLTEEAQANYVWEAPTADDATKTSVQFSITKAQAEITNLTLPGWVYSPDNANANEPDADSSFGTPTFTYYKGAVKLDAKPTAAGTYTVKATVEGTKNYEGGEDTLEFTIAKADASFSGYLEEYETEYNGSKYEISGITDTNTDIDVSFTYTKDGETVSEIKNAGTYTVTITLAESDNYNAAPESVEVTVTVNKKANTDTIPTYSTNSLGNAITFGDALSTISLPTSTYGTWTWNNSADLVGNATTTGNTHTATFTPYSQYADNYASREAAVTVIVAKKAIPTPIVPDANKSQTYTGGNLYVGIDNDTLYTVDDYTAIDVNTYTVYITLTAEAQNNYVWETPIESDATKTSVQFSITKATNAWTKSPAISKSEWDYGDSSIVFSAEAKCGTVSIKYTSDGGVTYSADVPTSVGTHTAVFYVAETDNYFGLSEVAVNFTINVGQAVITNFKAPGWAYMDFASTPVTAETNVGTVTFIYYDEAGNELADRPVNVGKYKVKAHVADDANGNYLGTTTTAIEFNIKKATPTLNEACYANESVTYQTSVSTSTSKLAATYQGADMAEAITLTGTFKFSSVTFVESTEETPSASYIKLTFTPTEDYADRFSTVTVTINMALKTLARVKNTDKDVPYGTIENALNAATAGDTVWVNPGTSSSIKITKSVTVKAGVTLMLPYGSAETDVNTSFTATGTSKTHSVTVKTKITVSSSVTITNYGTIQISGVISGSGGNAKYAGHTRGNCAQIVLGKNAKIVSKSGSVIKCFGYITESAANNGSSVTLEDGAQLYQPFVLRDFRGGGYMSGVYYKLSDGFTPFNMYQFINVMPTVRVNYGGELIGIVNLRANSKQNQELVTVVGYTSSAIIQLTDSAYSYLTSKTTVENAPSDATTSNILNPKYDYNNYKVTRVNIYGGAQTNPMHIELSVELIGNISLDTASTFFPVPYFYQISLLNNTKAGQTDAEFYMEQKFKFMTGSSLTIGEGVTLKASQLIFYEEFIDECTLSNTIYPEKPAAILNLYGTLICDTLGATVNIKSENARIIITKATSCVGKEVIESDNMYLSKSKSFTVYTFLVYDVSGQSIELSGPVGYYVANGELSVMTISFISDGGIEIPAVNVTSEVYPTLSNPTRTGYVFVGWYYGDTLVQKGDALQLIASHTLEARWRKLTIVEFNSDGGSTHDSVYADGTYNTLPTPTKEGYDFLGWYYGDTLVQNGDAVVSAEDHTLTAKWRKVISVTLDFDNGNSSSTILIDADSDTPIYSNLPTPTKTNHTFLGWYRGDVLVSAGDALSDLENHTLVARWRAHIGITLNTDGGNVTTETVYVDAVDDGKYPSLPTPTKTGYSFVGWYYEDTPIVFGDSLVSSEAHTLTARWKALISITLNADGGTVSNGAVYFDSDGPLVYPTLPTPTKEGHTFLGWYYEGTRIEAGSALLNTNEHTLVAQWEAIPYTLTVGTLSNASVSITVNGQTITSGTISIPYGSAVSITVNYSKDSNKTLTVKNESTGKNIYSGNSTSYEFNMPASAVTVTASSQDSCVTPDTLVTLADGTQVRIDSLTGNELLLVWNFYTGTYDVAPIGVLKKHGYSTVNVLTLYFEDGTSINTINGHGFFDVEANEFVIIRESNVDDCVGRSFVKQTENSYETVKLSGYSVKCEYTEVWSIFTVKHFNCVLEGMWSITEGEVPNSPSYLMPFEIGDNMKYDEALMQADIEKYGLCTYEDFKDYCTYEEFLAFDLEHFNITIGKGLLTIEELLYLVSVHSA